MLYRRYRPQKFSELVGLEAVKKTLLSQVASGQVGHAYLFAGPRGTGKTTTARILAKAVNCQQSKGVSPYGVDPEPKSSKEKGKGGRLGPPPEALARDGEPCGECAVCKQIEEGRFLDLIEIDAASNRGIDDIRALREKVRLAPSSARYKFYIIDEAHMLTLEAANALLKTLEEPPRHVIFTLCTTEPYKLPVTIRSRCQRFNFARASVPLIVECLEDICSHEGVELSKAELEEIARASGGGFRDAETLLEQVITGRQKVSDLAGFGDLENLSDFFDLLLAKRGGEALVYLNDLHARGVNMENLNRKILEYLRDLLLIKAGVGESLVEVGEEQFARMHMQATSLTSQQLSDMINKFTQSYENLPQSSVPTLPLEVAIVEVATPSQKLPAPGWSASGGESQRHKGETADQTAEEGPSYPVTQLPGYQDDRWQELMRRVKPLNHSVEALLHSCEPAKVAGRKLIIRAFYPFHKERLEEPKNRAILEEAAKEVYGEKLKLQVELAQVR